MEQSDVQIIMLDKLRIDGVVNKKNIEPTEDTVHSDILSQTDGYGSSNSANLYKDLVVWDIHNNGGGVKEWPENWLSQSVKAVASVLVCLLFVLMGMAQKPLTINLAAVRTDAGTGAVSLGVSYIPNLSFTGKEKLKFGSNSIFTVNPEVQITSGSGDAFSSIVAKVTGMEVLFKTHKVGKLVLSDVTKTVHTFPFSLGIESSTRFNFVNALFEAGYVPWYGASAKDTWLKHTKIGFFLQAGYKFRTDSTDLQDQSLEALNSGIFRFKGSLGVDSKALVTIQNLRLGLAGAADGWYDILNNTTYYRLMGALRMYLNGDNYLDFRIDRGSGAPLFQTGDQFGIALTMAF